MKREFIEYATYTLLYRNSKKNNYSILFSDFFLGICVSVMLVVSSIPLLISQTILWIALLSLWVFMIMHRKKENDAYMKALIIDGLFSLYAATFLSFVLVSSANKDINISPILLIYVTVTCLSIYEIIVLIRIKQKKYSYKKQIIASRGKKKTNESLISLLSCIGAFLGVTLSMATSKSIPFTIYQTVFIAIVVLLWICGCVLLQKYLILKILKYK